MDACYQEALQKFCELLEEARQTSLHEPTAMTLATVGRNGRLSARIVLLRGWDERGFVFYTNRNSDKGQQLADVPRAALCFHWDPLQVQVRVEGLVEEVAAQEADDYWRGRPRESQIGAWASQQSATLPNRQTLERRVAEFEERFAGGDVPRPEFWTGFRVVPLRIEFWYNRPARLHERVLYERLADGWHARGLYP